MLSFRQIEAFRAMMETGTVTATAESIGISQPAVSKLLVQLEANCGFPLFERARGRLTATADAIAFHRQVERAFLGLDELSRFLKELHALRQGRLVIGCLPSLASRWMPARIASFVAMHPSVTISLVVRTSPELANQVAARQLDLAVLRYNEPQHDVRIMRHVLFGSEVVCVLPRGHRLARKQVIEPRDLADTNFISLGLIDQSRQEIDAVLDAAGIRRRLTLDCGTAEAVCGMVAEGLGVSLVAAESAAGHPHAGMVVRTFRPSIIFRYWIAEPRNQPRSRLARAFAAHLRQYVAAGLG